MKVSIQRLAEVLAEGETAANCTVYVENSEGQVVTQQDLPGPGDTIEIEITEGTSLRIS